MRRAAGIAAASLIVAASATAAHAVLGPRLDSVRARGGLLTLTIDPHGLAPASVQVATSPATTASGAFPAANVKLRERLAPTPDTGTTTRRTQVRLPEGVYFVHISAVATGGVTSCQPHPAAACAVRWSNVVRVRITS